MFTFLFRLQQRLRLRMDRREVYEYIILNVFAVLIGLVGALGAILFRTVIHQSELLLGPPEVGSGLIPNPFGSPWSLLILVIPGIAGLLVGFIAYRWAPEVAGGGIGEILYTLSRRAGRIRRRVIPLQMLTSALTIGSGGSAGREGPVVHIGAGLGVWFSSIFGMSESRRRILLGCGVAAAIAATFNTPIAGVIFAVEVILIEFRTRSFIPLVVSSAFAAWLTRQLVTIPGIHTFVGRDVLFDFSGVYTASSPGFEFLFYIVLGLVCGAVAVGLVRTYEGVSHLFDRFPGPKYLQPMYGGFLFGAILLFFPLARGAGETQIQILLDGTLAITWLLVFWLVALLVAKVIATSITLGSGGSGGIITPSLLIGAVTGAAFGLVLNLLFPTVAAPYTAYALVGMGAVFAASSRATLTAILLIFEMTSDIFIVLPLMITAVIADGLAKLITRETVFTFRLFEAGIAYDDEMTRSPLAARTVSDVMVREVRTVEPGTPITTVKNLIAVTGFQGFPVVSKTGDLVGIVSQSDILNWLASPHGTTKGITVNEVMTSPVTTLKASAPLEEAMVIMANSEFGHLPVVDDQDTSRLVGLVTRKDLIAVHKRSLTRSEERFQIIRRRLPKPIAEIADDVLHEVAGHDGEDADIPVGPGGSSRPAPGSVRDPVTTVEDPPTGSKGKSDVPGPGGKP